MKGAHDLGGRHGLGAIDAEPEAEEPIFHAEWERRAFALNLALGMLGRWNIDEARYARERQHPVSYLENSYYENWLAGLDNLLSEKELLALSSELADRVPDSDGAKKILFSGGPTLMDDVASPLFAVGDRVRVKKIQTSGHTRAPGYAQGVVGTISEHYGTHVFPDA
ncbi:MAG: nitrile hydratase subunit beta, partial [Pseudomonadales bacterium]|nr:nitrile hydratase subunit beta [Pseudomonadales bacterium]